MIVTLCIVDLNMHLLIKVRRSQQLIAQMKVLHKFINSKNDIIEPHSAWIDEWESEWTYFCFLLKRSY